MTQAADDTAVHPPQSRRLADVDEYAERVARCPLCSRRVDHAIGTPSIETSALVDADLAAALGDEVPVFGFECHRHREVLQLLAPAAVAPSTYTAVTARVDGEEVEVAVPDPVLAQHGVDRGDGG